MTLIFPTNINNILFTRRVLTLNKSVQIITDIDSALNYSLKDLGVLSYSLKDTKLLVKGFRHQETET